MKNKLIFSVNQKGNAATWRAEGLPTKETAGGDFWRMMTDDGYYREMLIYSSQQTAKSVTVAGDTTTIVYDGLVSTDGRRFDIGLTLTAQEGPDGLTFGAVVDNHDKARVNELEYPYVDFSTVCDMDRARDVLIRPNGLGEQLEDPWHALMSAHTEYMSADYLEVKSTLRYPRPASMAWMGVESAGHFFYLGRHDPRTRACCLLCALPPRGEEGERLALAMCHYPFAKRGETVELPPVVAALSEGDFREGSRRYRAFADSTFYHPHPAPKWVTEMRGWQRIILRHQYGEIFWKYEDLPRLYLEGKESGLDTLLVFGWWKGRFDNGYPHYEVDEELGGADALRNAIAEVQRLGGRVILYNNGILIDKQSDFYKKHGHEVANIDIDGNEMEDHYKFENNGTVLRNYGYKSFVRACQATQEWQDVMVRNGRMKLSFGADAIFYDQLGSSITLCFNEKHKHGPRPDDSAVYRIENIDACRALLGEGQAIGTECTNDIISGAIDFIHGCERGCYLKDKLHDTANGIFPAMFRHTFPETVMTNRRVHDCREGFRDELNFAFVNGHRFDVSVYRGRKIGIKGVSEYAAHIKKLNALKDRYADFFFGGRFIYDTVPETLSGHVYFGEFAANGQHLLALANDKDVEAVVKVSGKIHTVPPHEVACMIL
ncbi:MAG: hypothetical protein IJX39_02580 [Clostridia bacterium]|nr:hypothetical protein [Clostridia bacterium]